MNELIKSIILGIIGVIILIIGLFIVKTNYCINNFGAVLIAASVCFIVYDLTHKKD